MAYIQLYRKGRNMERLIVALLLSQKISTYSFTGSLQISEINFRNSPGGLAKQNERPFPFNVKKISLENIQFLLCNLCGKIESWSLFRLYLLAFSKFLPFRVNPRYN